MAGFVTIKTGVFILMFLFSLLHTTEAQCNETGEPTFGQNCSFLCHCMDKELCDFTTGNCSKGCDFEWVGPACQRRNIILLKGMNEDYAVIRHSSNTSPNVRYALLAADENLTSCSYTNYANISKDNPWWRVWLYDRHTIRNIVIVTEKSATDYFKGFTVNIGNVTYANRFVGKFDSDKSCYTHTGSVPETNTIHVICSNPVIGNQVKIELASQNTQLVLCDVRIYGECQDGTFGEACTERCSQYCENTCDKINGTCESCRPGWAGSHCDHECATGFYGYGCQHNCSVNCVKEGRICDSINGSCLTGCQEGWFGKNCSQGCPWGFYGHDCLEKCSNNCAGGSLNCDRVYGSCISGCEAGMSGRKCDEECANGTWGFGCAYPCGNCQSKTCRPTDGVCYDNCLPGFKHSAHCDEVCVEGTYGLNCSNICSENCRGTCDKVTGKCFYCKSGWNGKMCSAACDEGSWGDNCKRRCLACHGDKCDRFSGRCYGLCKPGFKQTEYCDHECDTGWFGINCTEKCNKNCMNVSECRKSDGQCFGCKQGWEGEHCETVVKETNEEIPYYIFGVGIAVSSIVIFTISGLVLRLIIRKGKLERDKGATVSYTNNVSEDMNTNMCFGTEACETDRADNVYLTAIGNNETTNFCCAEADEIGHRDSVYQRIIGKSDTRTNICGAEADEIDHMDSDYQTIIGKSDTTTNICGAEAGEIDYMDCVYQTIVEKTDTTLTCGTEADDIDHIDSAYQTVKRKTEKINIGNLSIIISTQKKQEYYAMFRASSENFFMYNCPDDVDSANKPVYQKLNDVLDGT